MSICVTHIKKNIYNLISDQFLQVEKHVALKYMML